VWEASWKVDATPFGKKKVAVEAQPLKKMLLVSLKTCFAVMACRWSLAKF